VKHSSRFVVGAWAGALALGGVWAAGGCQSIAGIEDVEYLGTDQLLAGCSEYCDVVLEACPGDLSVYEDRETCEATCAAFDAANPSTTGNTLACRLEQARFAEQAETIEKSAHCPAAGPGGGSVCTSEEISDCEGYCSLYMQACDSISMKWGFGNEAECIQKCSALEPAGEYTVEAAPDTGDTLACRLYYSSRAALDPSEENCMSASLYPYADQKCKPIGDPDCGHYCDIVEVACVGSFEVYENRRQCEQVCANTDPGGVLDNGGQDTVGCRTYHAYNALALSELPHCSHSGPAGNGVCSFVDDGNCIPYCRLAKKGCSEAFDEKYGDDDAACLEDCRTIEGSVPNAMVNGYNVAMAQRGDTLQCRILHAARALEDPDNESTYCDAVFGGAPCVEED